MDILIIGYGKMGRAVEQVAQLRGHNIAGIIDVNDSFESIDGRKIDVAIEFTQPDSAVRNIEECFKRHIPVVVGTTGWYSCLEEVKDKAYKNDCTLFYSSNFSIGVYLFSKMNIWLSELMNKQRNYMPSVTEIHHIHKKDSPSGTAVTLAENLLAHNDVCSSWGKDICGNTDIMPVNSVRKGEEFGTHIISYESDNDIIEIKHTAKSRQGLAEGCVCAAEYLYGKKGVFCMDDMMKDLL